MSLEKELLKRAMSVCELCGSSNELQVCSIPPENEELLDKSLLSCSKCFFEIQEAKELDIKHWYCLNESIWSEYDVVKVMSFRLLKNLSHESWAQDLLDQIYMEEEVFKWALAGVAEEVPQLIETKDSNGQVLRDGDTVTLIKDLDVKGAGFTAKRGVVVKKISLTNNPTQIEGRVNGTQIVLLTKFLKKA